MTSQSDASDDRGPYETHDLLTRNVEEVVTDQEVLELAADPDGKRAYVGYEPSGVLHIGHLLTANKLIDLQEAGMEVVILLADVHAYLNGKGTFEEIRDTAGQMRAQFLAYGLDEASTEFVYGSDYQLDEEYVLDLHQLELSTTLNRAQRAMAELQSGESARVSHVVYPLMQALDIEYLDVDLAVGGMDQRKVHMLAREELSELGYDVRPCLHTPIVADLTTGEGKMSSSAGVTISMEDSTEDLEEKVNSAFCPPTRDPEGDLENPVLELFEYHIFARFDDVTVERPPKYGGDLTYHEYEALATDLESGDLHPADAKATLARYLDELIAPGREKLREIRGE
ncbi:tyrosine--tRNA ligase [Natronobiforma cellulositropha]|uniref:tyrosine--tRNA ligase n=1 Tax=Natronobiforma cellulositropha TaxID=1679076 RepID=UPI0021D58484|nr:tyrosine--tRNA ligase [Natronobiforma cellulositropha]